MEVALFYAQTGRTCHCGNMTDSRVFSQRCNILCSDTSHSCGGHNLYAVYSSKLNSHFANL